MPQILEGVDPQITVHAGVSRRDIAAQPFDPADKRPSRLVPVTGQKPDPSQQDIMADPFVPELVLAIRGESLELGQGLFGCFDIAAYRFDPGDQKSESGLPIWVE